MGDPAAAVTLYQSAGGALPTPTPVTSDHTYESLSEKEAREAQDKANSDALGGVLELHCGMLHYAVLFITNPQKPGLSDDFNAWLKNAAQAYPQLAAEPKLPPPAPADDTAKPDDSDKPHRHKANANGAPPFKLDDLKGKTMRDSPIAKFLGFSDWANHDQSDWSVKDIPKMYKSGVLDPLRQAPSPATLQAWDVYIAMEQADEPDDTKWTTIDYPPLLFSRSVDDYNASPATEKIEGLLKIINAYPTHPNSADWIASVKLLIADYRAKHGGGSASAPAPAPAPSAAAGRNSNVNVTTEKQGDATIIITHTNAPSATPGQ
jgi:hypothetical protein